MRPYIRKFLEENLVEDQTFEELLEEDWVQEQLVALASARSDLELVKEFISKGAELEGKDESGLTPIGCAVWNADIDLLALLIEAGADRSHRISAWRGISPLELAYEQKDAKPEKSELYDKVIELLKGQ